MEYPIEQLNKIIQEKEHFLLTSHVDPDGDGLGGILSLYYALKQWNKKPVMVLSTTMNDRYQFLPGCENILTEIPKDLPGNKSTVLWTVDAPNIPRLGFKEEDLSALDPFVINLDHHKSNERFGDMVILDEKSAASCEMIYFLLEGLKVDWNSAMATACYTGIITDTGRFRFSNTRPECFEAAHTLMKAGAKHTEVIRALFESKPYSRLELESQILNTMQREGSLAWMECQKAFVDQTGCEDTEDIVNRLTEVSGIEVAVFFREVEAEFTKISLRATNQVDVNQIASQFGGGGHAKAAGCKLKMSLEDAKETLLAQCKKSLKEYGHE